jgi:hypothetical protein
MRKLVSQLFVSLDGVIESPERWHLAYFNEEMQAAVDSQIVEGDILLLGRATYEVFAASWPTRGSDVPLADRINSMPKLVASAPSTGRGRSSHPAQVTRELGWFLRLLAPHTPCAVRSPVTLTILRHRRTHP